MLQLVSILSAGLSLLRPFPEVSFASARPSRKVVSPLSGGTTPTHIDDEDRGPTAWAMEHGIEPVFYRLSSRAAPSWSKLVKNLKRRQTKERAGLLLEYHVPPEAVLWLRHVIDLEDWSALLLLGRDGASDDEIAAAALVEAKRWEAALNRTTADPAPAADDEAGAAAPPAGPKPKG
ncbi:hypothetical protein J2766_000245 [Agrobacterium tumefaciens]|uniref:Uncharacterized protein n=1 Tax=Agrobacterium tumefaciens TaxID=358 RepID=A0AAW8LTW5_AGRTU|nr:hypothetical protein [Agrobacterium tumefaciens]MBP2563686.1 hypothetical protein [Agrobacterium tumefaciens]MDR6702451.1 hypothetical protein [Agrobacterium tumefaciens]